MKISTFKIEVLHLSRYPVKFSLQVDEVLLKQVEKFKYIKATVKSDGRQNEEFDDRLDYTSAVMRASQHLVVLKWKLLRKANLLVFKSMFVSIFTYSHESLGNKQKNLVTDASARLRFFAKDQRIYNV